MDLKGIHLVINKPMPDNATLERIEREIDEKGWIRRAFHSLQAEKIARSLGLICAGVGLIYPTFLIGAIVFFTYALLHFINYTLLVRFIRKYFEDNCG